MLRRGTYSIVARDPDTGELGVAVDAVADADLELGMGAPAENIEAR